ncbi:uncharacterized protein LOC116287322 isoform X2 [Actinia tenebrosa]|uniref:Uncharacterized protein LOC116287322 isoform X2 n=1 Tax=Actinia tenebrosa TaxID=6105 RepID=A0A6P8HBI2_ACTTE|nr:uncharacterized protein LOC116287322 isoform X2 [Actinia tenebrosa]
MAEQLHTFAFPFHTKINVNTESPQEEFPLQEISCQTPQNNQEKQEAKDGESEGLKNSPFQLRRLPELKNEQQTEKKLPVIIEKKEQRKSLEVFSPPKYFIFNEERSPVHLNVEALRPQKEKTTGVTLFEDDLIDEDANHLLRYYH